MGTLEDFDFQRVKLKPFYQIIRDKEKVYLLMAPCEVFEIPLCFFRNGFLDRLESDGGLYIEELRKINNAEELGKMHQFIKELWTHNFLMSLDCDEFFSKHEINRFKEWLPFFSRFTNKPFSVAMRLREQQIGIFTNCDSLACNIREAIEDLPFLGDIRIFTEESSSNWQHEIDSAAFIIVGSLGFYPSLLLKANRVALSLAKPMLPVILMPDGLSGIIGPFTNKKGGPCWNCFYRRYAGQGTDLGVYEFLTKISAAHHSYQLIWSSSFLSKLIMPEIICALTNVEAPRTQGRVLFINLFRFDTFDHPVLTLPRCEYCSNINSIKEKPIYSPYGF